MRDYSASCAEIGQNAGADTWQASCENAPDWQFLKTDDDREDFKSFVLSSVGWTDEEEISAWSDNDLQALCLQWIAGDIRECTGPWADRDEEGFTWEQYREDCEAGIVPSSLYADDEGLIYWAPR